MVPSFLTGSGEVKIWLIEYEWALRWVYSPFSCNLVTQSDSFRILNAVLSKTFFLVGRIIRIHSFSDSLALEILRSDIANISSGNTRYSLKHSLLSPSLNYSKISPGKRKQVERWREDSGSEHHTSCLILEGNRRTCMYSAPWILRVGQ